MPTRRGGYDFYALVSVIRSQTRSQIHVSGLDQALVVVHVMVQPLLQERLAVLLLQAVGNGVEAL